MDQERLALVEKLLDEMEAAGTNFLAATGNDPAAQEIVSRLLEPATEMREAVVLYSIFDSLGLIGVFDGTTDDDDEEA